MVGPLSMLRLPLLLGLHGAVAQDLFIPGVPAKPNLIWFLTDDQDQLLGGSFPVLNGVTPMPKTKQLMQDEGAYASNWYIHTPICSPSRSELLTGRYFHNIKQVGGGGSGMHVNYTLVNENTFVRALKENAGYATGMFGKYVNEMPKEVPPGFDAWFANGGGSYMNPGFDVLGIDGLPDGHVQFSAAPENYSTSLIGNKSIDWIKKVAKTGQPFVAYIAPKAAHEPFNPAPWYRDSWDPSWPQREPRTPNWNCSKECRADHHGNIATEPMLTEDTATTIHGIFKNRWRCLMSVDDLIADVIKTVDELGMSDHTYFMYSSDHGFQLGQFNIPMDKRHVYEWDTKIHLLARGPGIKGGTVVQAPGTQVDIAPTLLGLAGLEAPGMDGKSIVPFLLDDESVDYKLPDSVRWHLSSLGSLSSYRKNWRTEVFIEYYFCNDNTKCYGSNCVSKNQYPANDSPCTDLTNNKMCWCEVNTTEGAVCYPTESTANNFIALRVPATESSRNTLYAEFQEGDQGVADIAFNNLNFKEFYDVDQDPWQMHNLAKDDGNLEEMRALSVRLHKWFQCSGASCL